MITEARIEGRVRRLAPKRWEDVEIHEPCVLAEPYQGDPPMPPTTRGTIHEKYEPDVLIFETWPGGRYVALKATSLLFPVREAPEPEAQRYKVEPTHRGQVLVKNSDESWSCTVYYHTPFAGYFMRTHVVMPRGMPEDAASALRRWLDDQIIIEEANDG